MAIQNDNTLVTKGDLKSLYTDKIAPYLGGGISYYYTDRTGEELKCGDYNIQGNPTIPVGTSQNTHLTLSARGGTHPANFILKDGNIVIPGGTTVTITSNMVVNNNGSESETNSLFMIYDYKNSMNVGYASAVYHGNGVARSGSYTYNFTAPEGGAEIGIKCTYNAVATRTIGGESGLTITEVGRIVDPVKYVSNNSDLQETPVGNIISYMGNSVPKHYLACDGATYSIGTYPELEAFIIDEFGSINYFGGDGTSTWAVPDLRGEFLRGTGTNSRANCGNGTAVGKHQNPTQLPVVGTQGTASTSYITGRSVIKDDTLTPTWYTAQDSAVNTVSGSTPKNIRVQGTITETGGTDNAITVRPTTTSVNYCIKYESTFHAFFSNAAYKVSVAASVTASNAVQLIFDSSDIIGDSSLISENSLVAPMDGWYSLGMNWSQSGSGDIGYYIKINNLSGKGYNRGIFISDTLYLNKGDVITIWKESGSANSGRVNFCLLTSNYNPTIVSADSVYSENEQMIGYWKDGKPLYQRTLVYNNRVLGADINTNLDKNTINIIDYDFIHYANSTPTGDVVNKGGCHPQGASTWASWLYFVKSSDSNYWKVASRVGSSLGVSTCSFTITVRYTKTTDAASSLEIENSLLLNRPDLWTPGTEYHFGGGLYGIRKTGTITSIAAGGRADVTIVSNLSNATIVNSGGIVENSDYKYSVPSTHSSTREQFIWYNKTISDFSTNSIIFYIGNLSSSTAISSQTYDVWVTYKK